MIEAFSGGCHSAFIHVDIVDIKPANMEELTEVITAADFHPTHCSTMMYSTSRGAIKLGDMRQAALCDSYSQGAQSSLFLSFLWCIGVISHFSVLCGRKCSV